LSIVQQLTGAVLRHTDTEDECFPEVPMFLLVTVLNSDAHVRNGTGGLYCH